MFFNLLALATFATAVPLTARQTEAYPPTSTAKGFHLVANVTKAGKLGQERFAELHGTYVWQYREGPGADIPSLTNNSRGSTFWQNDTTVGATEFPKFRYAVMADWLEVPDYFDIAEGDGEDTTKNRITFTRRGGMEGFHVADGLNNPWTGQLQFPMPHESEVTLAACIPFEVPWFPNPQIFMVYGNVRDGGVDWVMPENCAHITLLAECAELPPLYEKAQYTREYAMEVPCFENVKGIDWNMYGA